MTANHWDRGRILDGIGARLRRGEALTSGNLAEFALLERVVQFIDLLKNLIASRLSQAHVDDRR